MEYKYIDSELIRIFPYADDRSVDPFGQHLNEQNLRNLVKHFTTHDSFFIGVSDVTSDYQTEGSTFIYKKVEFFIAGHYVNFVIPLKTKSKDSLEIDLNDANTKFWLTNHIYAQVEHYDESQLANLLNKKSYITYSKLYGKDNDKSFEFEGVKFLAYAGPDSAANPLPLVRSIENRSISINNGVTTNLNTVVTTFKLFNPITSLTSGFIEISDQDFLDHVPPTAYERFAYNTMPPYRWFTLTKPSNS